MKISYFKRSNRPYEEVIKDVSKIFSAKGWEVKGEGEVNNGKIFYVFNRAMMEEIINFNKDFVGFFPSVLLVFKEGGKTVVGGIDGAFAANLITNNSATRLKSIEKMAKDIKEIINSIAQAEESRPKRTRIFSTVHCPYCKMEKDWFEKNKLSHEVVYVDSDQEMASYMVKKTGQMGVPVTEIEFEDGETEYIIGFDKGQLADIFKVSN
ncbi:MAG: hypothetical protein M1155_01660 [Patescibacteria group bacterium]|nr:hypothetical protein [Patescibacteria group bacterium]